MADTGGNSIYALDDDIPCPLMNQNVVVNPIVGDLGPWPKGELHGEHEGIRSPVPSDVMMDTRSTSPQHQPSFQHPMEYKMEFHPCSNLLPLLQSFDQFCANTKTFTPPTDNTPYHPFWVAGDFEFMEVALAASLNQVHVDKLLDLISCVAQGTAQVALKNNVELCKACDAAAAQLMPVIFMHPVWEWALDLLENELLAPHFVWDAQHLYKYSEEGFEHFYNEPWTADCWWDIQSSLPGVDNAVPFSLIIYANKMKLSSFGTAKGYPVVVQFLRILKRRAAWATQTSSDKSGMSALSSYSKTFPNTRKLGICTSPYDKVYDVADLRTYPLCLMDQAQDVLSTYNYSHMAGEEQLKAIGLWPIENVFWHIRNSDPHATLSFDCLHSSHDGVGGRHALQDVKKILNALGREAEVEVEDYISKFPRWHSLSHFKNAINVTFSDGNKKRNLEIFYACLNVFTKKWTPEDSPKLPTTSSPQFITGHVSLRSQVQAEAHELHKALAVAQKVYADACTELHSVWKELTALSSAIPTHKCNCMLNKTETLNSSITKEAKKYLLLYHFWVADGVFPMTLKPSVDPCSPSCWDSPRAKMEGMTAELYSIIPESLHDALGQEQSNVLKCIKDAASLIFAQYNLDLSMLSTQDACKQMDPKFQALLTKNNEYTQHAPILFKNHEVLVPDEFLKSPIIVLSMNIPPPHSPPPLSSLLPSPPSPISDKMGANMSTSGSSTQGNSITMSAISRLQVEVSQLSPEPAKWRTHGCPAKPKAK
ncbi:hypothetical protein EDC04DRAFT_2615507 [Pisolithus marmoratus]|nr:hypothetical protein EDC04DRAFT_2615507 [Pisolithus marmoratus]